MSDIIPNLTIDSIPNPTGSTANTPMQGTQGVPVAPTGQSSPILGVDGQPLVSPQFQQQFQQQSQQQLSQLPVQNQVQPQQTQQPQQPATQPQVQSTTDFSKDNPVGVEISTGTKAAINLFERSTGNNLQSIMDLASHAIQQGDNSLLNKTALQLQFGENAAQAEAVVQAIIEDTKQARMNIANHCYAKVGGEQQWGQLVSAFRGTADKGTVEAVKTLFDSGHIDVAISMMQQHVGSTTKVTQGNPGTMLQGGTSVQQGISASQLQQALVQLKQKYPNQSWETGAPAEEYNTLLNLRRLGVQAGI